MTLAYWVHHWSPFLGPHWGNIGIRYYGLAYLVGFVGAYWLFYRYAREGRSQMPAEKIPDFMVALVLGVMVGGRLGSYLLYNPEQLVQDPLSFFRVWEGGMASHGGFVGVTIAAWIFARIQGISFWHLGDLIASATPVGLLFGRIANFINGELYGKITDVRWAVIFPRSAPDMPIHQILPRHPSQLYEAGLEGALMLALMQWRFWRSDVVRTQPGRLCGEFMVAYALVRMLGEAFREPDASLLFGVSRGTFYSVFLIAGGLVFILQGRRQRQHSASRTGADIRKRP